MPVTDCEWGSEVLIKYQHFFRSWKTFITRDLTTPIRSGQVWNALPAGAYMLLVGKRHHWQKKQDAERQCFAAIADDEWRVIPQRLPGPCPWEVHIAESDDSPVDFKHLRPGILLCESHSRTDRSAHIQRFGRAIWTRSDSTAPARYECLRILGASYRAPGRPARFPLWTAWGVSINEVVDSAGVIERRGHLLDLVGDLSRSIPERIGGNPHVDGNLHQAAARLLAELVGVRPTPNGHTASPPKPLRRMYKPIPRRGEIVLVRFGVDKRRTPCLVVSPDEFNLANNDLVVLRSVPYIPDDERINSTTVPLPDTIHESGHRVSIDTALVRGIPFAERYVDACTPTRVFLEQGILEIVDRKLRSLYA